MVRVDLTTLTINTKASLFLVCPPLPEPYQLRWVSQTQVKHRGVLNSFLVASLQSAWDSWENSQHFSAPYPSLPRTGTDHQFSNIWDVSDRDIQNCTSTLTKLNTAELSKPSFSCWLRTTHSAIHLCPKSPRQISKTWSQFFHKILCLRKKNAYK